jgi:catechol 2,3-dioxygenase-like lactoylglutathione lyase family enzyme
MIESIDHVNIVVTADLEAMVRFYTDLLGLKVTKRARISGEWIDRVVGLRGSEAEVVYVSPAAEPRIELLKYISPVGERPHGLELSNTGGIRHIALRVHGIEQIVQKLRASGVKFLSDVQQVPDTQVTYAGGVRKRLVYFHDPEANLLELCEYASPGQADE